MPRRLDRSGGNKAVAVLATCAVILGGATVCAFIGLASAPEPRQAMAMAAACFVGIVLFLWTMGGKTENHSRGRWGWLSRDRPPKIEFQVKLRRPATPLAPQSPPTAESVRDLSGGLHTWVPARGHSAENPRTRSS